MRIDQEKGFTLVEILVAVVIFSFAALGLAMGTVTLARNNADAHSRANAINVAQARLEELKAMNGATLTALTAVCTSPSSGGCSDTFSASGITFSRKWWFAVNSPVVGVNRIDVEVAWTDHGSRALTFSAAVPQ